MKKVFTTLICWIVIHVIINFENATNEEILMKKNGLSRRNLIKYDGVQLPGGVNLNGRQLFEDAITELNQIEEDMQLRNELPVDMMIGAGPF